MMKRLGASRAVGLCRGVAAALFLLLALGCLATSASAQADENTTIAVGGTSSPLFATFVNFCDLIAPYCGVICFLAPFPTIMQVSRNKTVGNLPLLPYSSMVANGFVWVCYGLLKSLPSVLYSNAVGVVLGAYYFATFVRHCGPMASNLPGTVGLHIKGAGAVILLNLCLAGSKLPDVAEWIGKEGVVFCVILFASPLAALKHVIATKSAASIPLPFTLACFVNCTAWSVMGWWKLRDFNIYFPNLLGLASAVTQLALKGMYGDRAGIEKKLPM